jgi:hypothetical protein
MWKVENTEPSNGGKFNWGVHLQVEKNKLIPKQGRRRRCVCVEREGG